MIPQFHAFDNFKNSLSMNHKSKDGKQNEEKAQSGFLSSFMVSLFKIFLFSLKLFKKFKNFQGNNFFKDPFFSEFEKDFDNSFNEINGIHKHGKYDDYLGEKAKKLRKN